MVSTLRMPQQDRSRDKLERIYEVSVELLTEGGWDAVTVGEVERRSGVSRSTFYLRFPTREALIAYTRQRFLETVSSDEAAAFDRARAKNSTTLDDAVAAAVEAMAAVFRAYGGALMRIDRPDETGAGGTAMTVLSEQFRSVLRPVLGDDAAVLPAAQFATQLAFSALVLEIQPRDNFPAHELRGWAPFLDELCCALVHYLRGRCGPVQRRV